MKTAILAYLLKVSGLSRAEETERLVVPANQPRRYRHIMRQIARIFHVRKRQGEELPPSNPDGWPHSSPEDISARPKRIIKVGTPQAFSFCNNNVKTSKYEIWDFVPKFLLEEFNPKTKIANCYFLLISGLQCIPAVSNTGGIPTTLLPLTVVVCVDALFQIIEDVARHRADTRANSSNSMRFNRGVHDFVPCKWSEIVVGDIIKIQNREMIPADVVVLGVAEKTEPPNGMCYVETKSLDGETNLKIRKALSSTINLVSRVIQMLCISKLILTVNLLISGERKFDFNKSQWRNRNGTPQ